MKTPRKISLLLLTILITVEVCQSIDLQRAFAQRGTPPSDEVLVKKRSVICNTWGGCRGKRFGSEAPDMSLPQLFRQRQVDGEALASLLELAGEPAAEEPFLSEARMWEALRQADGELNRRRATNYPLGYSAQ